MNRSGAGLYLIVFFSLVISLFAQHALQAKPISSDAKSQNASRLKVDLRVIGKRLELSASYQPSMRIESPLPAPTLTRETRLGDCDFYEEFLQILAVERSNAVEAKIRGLSLEEGSQFIASYSERLRYQEKWTIEIGNKLDLFHSRISHSDSAKSHCEMESHESQESRH